MIVVITVTAVVLPMIIKQSGKLPGCPKILVRGALIIIAYIWWYNSWLSLKLSSEKYNFSSFTFDKNKTKRVFIPKDT